METQTNSVRSQPLLAVDDVLASSHWYAQLLNAQMLSTTIDDTHGNTYNRIFSGNQIILQLHSWDDDEHPNLVGRDEAKRGHGALIWFEVDDFDGAVARAYALGVDIILEPHVNPGPKHREIWLRDLDGYVVVIASCDGETATIL